MGTMGDGQKTLKNLTAKKECLTGLLLCAGLYEEYLNHNSLLFIYRVDRDYKWIESVFDGKNFKHLTGVESLKNPTEFYSACIDQRLSLADFELDEKQLCFKKIKGLKELTRIEKTGRMIGEYIGGRQWLQCDKVAGSVKAAMGLVRIGNGNTYVPASVLEEDTRNLTTKAHQIIAIYKKKTEGETYSVLTKLARPLKIDNLKWPENIRCKLESASEQTFLLPEH